MKRDDLSIERGSENGATHRSVWDELRFPGLTPAASEVSTLLEELPRRFAVLDYREKLPVPWLVFVGGTGTGKSTLFNAFCGEDISAMGAERPKTHGAILYCHQDCAVEEQFPFPRYATKRLGDGKDSPQPIAGKSGQLLIWEHQREEWSRLVVADTPDLDSVAAEHRETARDLCLLSDQVVFVTSQEKYADEVPHRFLANVKQEGSRFALVLNKLQGDLTSQDVRAALETDGILPEGDPIWFVPWTPTGASKDISLQPGFQRLASHLLDEFFGQDPVKTHRNSQKRRAKRLAGSLGKLYEFLELENEAAQDWFRRLEELHKTTSQDLLRSERVQFADQSRRHLAREIRKLFARYDVLAGPRRFLRNVLLKPFRLVGLNRAPEEAGVEEQLRRVRDRVDLTPIVAAVEDFNRRVLETLSPDAETAPLFSALRNPDLPFRQDDIQGRVWKQQEQLANWLEAKFQELSKGIPTGKKLGIYGTSVTWGVLIIAFETALGGGFTVLDAALDSVLAPMVTKGSVELFAYREIRNIARELAKRYETGLLSILDEQRKRYEDVLQSLTTRKDTLEQLKQLRTATAEW
jgi:hypothetical protein